MESNYSYLDPWITCKSGNQTCLGLNLRDYVQLLEVNVSTQSKMRVLDPTGQPTVVHNGMAARPDTLDGSVVGLLANQKLNAEPLLEAIYDVLSERFELGGRVSVNKGDASRPAPPEVLDSIASDVDVVITANGD